MPWHWRCCPGPQRPKTLPAQSNLKSHKLLKHQHRGGAEGAEAPAQGSAAGAEAQVTEAPTAEAQGKDVATVVPKSPFLTILKASVNYRQDEHKRKFLIKGFGTLPTTLAVAEVFAKMVSQSRSQFDQVSKKPELRKEYLMKFGWPEGKSCKRDLKSQLAFIMNALRNEKSQQLEAAILVTCIRCTMGQQSKNCYLTHRSDGFHARVKPKDDV